MSLPEWLSYSTSHIFRHNLLALPGHNAAPLNKSSLTISPPRPVSTAPVHAQEPSPITTPGAVTVATSLPHSFWIPRRSTRRRLAGHLVGSRHCRYFRPVRSHRDRDRRQSIPHELALAGLRDRRDRLRGTRHAGNPRVPGRTVGGAQRDRHGACRACGRPWRYWLARWDG